jgi:sugar/nucleoside kinase (ribokinase family)
VTPAAAEPDLDVVAVGNALVDVLSPASDDFLLDEGLYKGATAIIEADRSADLYDRMGPGTEMSGGSAANTAVGVASLGGRSAFVGRVRDDLLGQVFAHDIRASGVRFETSPATAGPPTGRCLILVTPDGERTMNTYLGAASELHTDDVAASIVGTAAVTYLEGYLFDEPDAKSAFRHAASAAHDAGRRVALSLSDSFCVERHRRDFLGLVEHEVDILFANEAEACLLFGVPTLEDAVDAAARYCEVAAVTQGAKGSVVVGAGGSVEIPVHPVPSGVVDTTGAGDLYAAGFLFAFTHGHGLELCGRLGALAASEVIAHLGGRPEHSLAELAAPLLR